MKNLIEKYFNGETSLQEEAELKAYFISGNVEESLKEYLPLFQFLREGQHMELSADFDKKLFEKIDAGTNRISHLLDKYFEGETSIDEEATLQAYFNSGQVDTSFKQYQPLFQYFKEEKEMKLSADFEDKLFAKMEVGAKVIQMNTWQRKLLRVAAAVAILFGAYLFTYKPIAPSQTSLDWTVYEIHDEQLAYEETVKALKLLSSKLNKAKHKTVHEIAKSEPASKYLN